MFRSISWIIKLSKLCNMRCSYCYEWNELGNPERMSAKTVREMFRFIRDFHYTEMKRWKSVPASQLVWHGGEPLLLPLDYLEEIQAIKHECFGNMALQRRYLSDSVQTNLFLLRPGVIDYLKKHRIGVGVSFDYIPGVRLSVAGKPTEGRVLENMAALRDAGIPFGVIVVVAKHNAGRIREVYDGLIAKGIQKVRFLPLFSGPGERPSESFACAPSEVAASMCTLFDHWVASGLSMQIAPFDKWVPNVVRYLLGIETQMYDRRRHGDEIFVVDMDGKIYQGHETYGPEHELGDCMQSVHAMMTGEKYAVSLVRDDARRKRACQACEFRGPCNTFPVFATDWLIDESMTHCGIPHVIHAHIARRFTEWGYTHERLGEMLCELLGLQGQEAAAVG